MRDLEAILHISNYSEIALALPSNVDFANMKVVRVLFVPLLSMSPAPSVAIMHIGWSVCRMASAKHINPARGRPAERE